MGSSLRGLIILAVLLTGSLVLWRVNLVRNNLIHGANRDALQLEGARARTVPSIITAKCDRNNNTLAVNVTTTAQHLSRSQILSILISSCSTTPLPKIRYG